MAPRTGTVGHGVATARLHRFATDPKQPPHKRTARPGVRAIQAPTQATRNCAGVRQVATAGPRTLSRGDRRWERRSWGGIPFLRPGSPSLVCTGRSRSGRTRPDTSKYPRRPLIRRCRQQPGRSRHSRGRDRKGSGADNQPRTRRSASPCSRRRRHIRRTGSCSLAAAGDRRTIRSWRARTCRVAAASKLRPTCSRDRRHCPGTRRARDGSGARSGGSRRRPASKACPGTERRRTEREDNRNPTCSRCGRRRCPPPHSLRQAQRSPSHRPSPICRSSPQCRSNSRRCQWRQR
jgi:hypothetical protein